MNKKTNNIDSGLQNIDNDINTFIKIKCVIKNENSGINSIYLDGKVTVMSI